MIDDITLHASGQSAVVHFVAIPMEASNIEAADADDAGRPRRFSMPAYHGGKLEQPTLDVPVVVDLAAFDTSRQQVPALRDHDQKRPIGHVDRIEATERVLNVSGVFSLDNADSREVINGDKNRFPWQVSIGARGGTFTMIPEGTSINVNGQAQAGPFILARGQHLYELSFLSLGADVNAFARIAANADTPSPEILPMTFNEWLEASGFDPAALSDTQLATLRAAYEAQTGDGGDEPSVTAEAPKADASDVAEEAGDPKSSEAPKAPSIAASASAASAFNVSDIRAAAREEISRERNVERARIDKIRSIPNMTAEVADYAIQAGFSPIDAELHLYRTSLGRRSAPASNAGGPKQADVIEASLCLTAGIAPDKLAAQLGQATVDAAMTGDMQGIGLRDVMAMSIRAAGRDVPVGDGVLKAALGIERDNQNVIQAGSGAGYTTISLSGILNNVANRVLLQAYSMVPGIAERIARVDASYVDFNKRTSYRVTLGGGLKKVGKNGELKQMSLDETEYVNKIDTEGGIVALSRQDLLNDNLGAFLQIPQGFGNAAARGKERAVIEALGGDSSFYSVANGNVLTGASSALSIDSLSVAVRNFREQVDVAGDPIMIEPRYLVVGPANETLARQIVATGGMLDGHASKLTYNPHAGMFEVMVSPYIGRTENSAANNWYLMADPASAPAVELGYLRGRRRPFIEQAGVDFASLGIQFRAFHDVGVARMDHRAVVKGTGS